MLNQNFNGATTPEGDLIVALSPEALATMEQRCARYAAQCEATGKP